jgi:hypothetical protein
MNWLVNLIFLKNGLLIIQTDKLVLPTGLSILMNFNRPTDLPIFDFSCMKFKFRAVFILGRTARSCLPYRQPPNSITDSFSQYHTSPPLLFPSAFPFPHRHLLPRPVKHAAAAAPFALPSSIPPRSTGLALVLVAGGDRPCRSGGRSGRVPVESFRLVSSKTAVDFASSNPPNRVEIQIFSRHQPSPSSNLCCQIPSGSSRRVGSWT